MRCHSVRLKIGGREKNLQLTLYPSQGQQNVFFFQAIIPFTIFTAIVFRLWSMFGSTECGSREAKTSNGTFKKGLSEAIKKMRHENAARLLSTVQNDGNNVKFWASLETNFLSTFLRLKLRWLAKVSARFLLYAS